MSDRVYTAEIMSVGYENGEVVHIQEPTTEDLVAAMNVRDDWTIEHRFNPNTGRNLWLVVSDE